jgi:uncharacterized membrane protein YphA (DoxX/SURF4 family)
MIVANADRNTLERRIHVHAIKWETAAVLYARIALGAAFLSAVAGRFGLWQGTFDWEYFAKFQQYAAEVNSFMPSAVIPAIPWTATVAETTMGVLLILGLWPRWVSLASTVLLAMFGTAMAISFGLKSPMDYSVFSASSAAALLSLHAFSQNRNQAAFKKH